MVTRVELLFDAGDDLVGAVLSGHVEEWTARVLARDSEAITGVDDDDVAPWAEARVHHLWWREPDRGEEWTLVTSAAPGDGLVPCTHVAL